MPSEVRRTAPSEPAGATTTPSLGPAAAAEPRGRQVVERVRVEGHRLGRRVADVGRVLDERVDEREQVLDLAPVLELLHLELVVLRLQALPLLALLPQVAVRIRWAPFAGR